MNKTWTIIEKIIGILIGIWGVISLYGVTNKIANVIRSGYAAANHLTYSQIFLDNHVYFLIAIASLFGGFMLAFNDKQGWMLSVISTVVYVVTFFRSSQTNAQGSDQPYFQYFKSYAVMALLFIAILILLLQKPFRKKYQPTRKNWMWMVIITTILVIDKLIF